MQEGLWEMGRGRLNTEARPCQAGGDRGLGASGEGTRRQAALGSGAGDGGAVSCASPQPGTSPSPPRTTACVKAVLGIAAWCTTFRFPE